MMMRATGMMPTDRGDDIVAFDLCSALDDLCGMENDVRRSNYQIR